MKEWSRGQSRREGAGRMIAGMKDKRNLWHLWSMVSLEEYSPKEHGAVLGPA